MAISISPSVYPIPILCGNDCTYRRTFPPSDRPSVNFLSPVSVTKFLSVGALNTRKVGKIGIFHAKKGKCKGMVLDIAPLNDAQ